VYSERVKQSHLEPSKGVSALHSAVIYTQNKSNTYYNSRIIKTAPVSKQILPNTTVQFAKFCGTIIPLITTAGPFSMANFAKFRDTTCEIPQHYYPKVPYIPQPIGIIVLTDNTSKYSHKEFTVTWNTKTHYIRPLMMKISSFIIHQQ